MLNIEGQWSENLAGNNITGIIQWLQKITDNDDANMEKILPVFSCWVQRTSESAKKELLTLCFSHCQGLWMFLDRSSFTRVHVLLQKLRNLLTLVQWLIRHYGSAHLQNDVGVPCTVCCGACKSSWNLESRSIKQHIWLGRLVQWWGIMGLLPKYPEPQEEKRISQMWREMDQSHRKACAEMSGLKEGGMEQGSSFIQGMVCQLVKQHGCIWTSEDHVDQDYPPPNLQALLKLVLVPCVDNISVQAVIMYFVLDMANFLQCRDDLLQSFCRAFTIPSSFSQQIRAFWLLDHGHVKASMELLLSPRAAAPQLSWQHRYIIHCLLLKKQPRLALRYLQWARPAMESTDDVKLCADVLLQNSRVSEAWTLLRRGHSEREDLVTHFLQACNGFGLSAEALKCVPAGCSGKRDDGDHTMTAASLFPKMTKGRPPCPLSARLYQAQRGNTLSSEELIKLVTTAVMEVRQPRPKIRAVVWPQHTDTHSAGKEMFLSTEAVCHLTPGPRRIDPADGSEPLVHRNEPEEEHSRDSHPETPEHTSSSGSSAIEDLSFASSVSSFTSASSLPPLRRDRPYIYESTLTLQRISALLTDGLNHKDEEEVNQRREEEEEQDSEEEQEELEETQLEDEVEVEVNPSLSSAGVFTDSSELTVILDGSSAPVSLMNLSKDISVVQISTGDEEVETDPAQRPDPLRVDAFSGLSIPETLSSNDSFDPVSIFEPHTEKDIFLLPGIMDLSPDQEDLPSQIFGFSGATTSDCLQEKKLFQVQRAYEQQHQEETEESFREDLLCARSETFHHLQADVHQRFQSEKPRAGSQALNPADPLITNIKTSSSSFDTSHENASQMQLKKEDISVQSTSGSWWKYNLEMQRVSSSQKLPVTEAGADSPKRPSVGSAQPYCYSLFNFTEKHKGDDRGGKQSDKEYAAGWSSLAKDSQGAIRTRSRKGKRGKRT